MAAHVKVYPTKASALNVTHPHGPKMAIGGATWPKDSFTGRRLTDGSVTEDPAKAYVPPQEPIEPAAVAPPAAPSTPSASQPSVTD